MLTLPKVPIADHGLSPEAWAEASKLLRQHYSWGHVAERIGVTRYVLYCAFRPGFREKCRIRQSINRRKPRAERRPWSSKSFYEKYGPHTAVGYTAQDAKVVIPETVEQERARLSEYQPDITAALFGDPPPWRSALGRRNEARENP